MQKLSDNLLVEAISEALETVAFMMVMPPEDELPITDDNMLGQVEFSGPVSGTIEILAPVEFVYTMTANIMGLDDTDEVEQDKAEDAFRELLNITCGIVVERLACSPADMFNISIPQLQDKLNQDGWNEFTAAEATILDVDGLAVAVRLILTDKQ